MVKLITMKSKLAQLWEQRIAVIVNADPKPLTPKEAGQLKQLFRFLGIYTEKVVDYTLDNWPKFGARIITKYNCTTYPETPHTGFLFTYLHEAVWMMVEEKLISAEELQTHWVI
jgi:hypothetical protein